MVKRIHNPDYSKLTHDGKTWRDEEGNPVATTWWTSITPGGRIAIVLAAGIPLAAIGYTMSQYLP